MFDKNMSILYTLGEIDMYNCDTFGFAWHVQLCIL